MFSSIVKSSNFFWNTYVCLFSSIVGVLFIVLILLRWYILNELFTKLANADIGVTYFLSSVLFLNFTSDPYKFLIGNSNNVTNSEFDPLFLDSNFTRYSVFSVKISSINISFVGLISYLYFSASTTSLTLNLYSYSTNWIEEDLIFISAVPLSVIYFNAP